MKLKHDAPDVVERASVMIERQVAHMVRLIDELMDVSRITRGKLRLILEPVRISEVIAAAIELSDPLLEKSKVKLEVRGDQQEVVLRADRMRLAQVFSNLLNNAAKYTEPGGSVTVTTTASHGIISVAVEDTGIGIPAEQMPHLFELFTQIDRSLNRSQNGLGIGLALAHRLVSMHDGRLEAASPGIGRGATFTVRLPFGND
jgi:signal transduction histidine kinase